MSGLKAYEIFQQLQDHKATALGYILLSYINECYHLPDTHANEWRRLQCSPRVLCDRASDSVSSLLVQNLSFTETLRVGLEIAGSEIKHYEVKANTTRPIELALSPIPVIPLCFQNISFSFSHPNYIAEMRQEKLSMAQYHFAVRNPFVVYFDPRDLCYIYAGFYRQGQLLRAILPEDQPGFLMKNSEGEAQTWKLRHYEWVQVPEVMTGKYRLPVQDYQIMSSIYVHISGTDAQQLYLRPVFRHSYTLKPGHNCFELFYAEFWVPEKQPYFLEGPPGLTIWVRAGNQLEPKFYPDKVVDKEMPPALLLTQDGWVYRRYATHVEVLDQINEAGKCCKTLLLALEHRVGANSSVQRYLLREGLSEKMLLRQIVDFL